MNPALSPTNRRFPTIGDLIHRFALESPVRSADGAGGATRTFALISEVWGDLRALGGHERLDADRLGGRITHAIWLRYRDGLTPDFRLRLGTRIFEIRAILNHNGRQRFLECHCEEFVT